MIISACQHWLDGPIEEDEGSQAEDGSNIGGKDGSNKSNDKDDNSKQEHTKDNAPTASAMSINSGMFIFFSWCFFIFYFTFLLGSLGM